MRFRIPILPATVSEGVITFNTISIITGKDEVQPRIEESEPVNIYLDPSREPKFSKSDVRGWCSPPIEKRKAMEESGVEPEFCLLIDCSCQRGPLTREDRLSLEQTGHTAECERAPQRTPEAPKQFQMTEVIPQASIFPGNAPLPPGIDPEILAMAQQDVKPEPKKDFKPDYGVWVEKTLPDLISQLIGAETQDVDIDSALKRIGWKEPYELSIVAKQLMRHKSFSICKGCKTWQYITDIAKGTCVGCESPASGDPEEHMLPDDEE